MIKKFIWNKEKNEILKKSRNISFEEIKEAIEMGSLIAVEEHKNKNKYPNQKIFIVNIKNYAYEVPFVENEKEIFLKTIFKSRKATKKYIKS